MKYGFIKENRQEFSIVVMCSVLGVSSSGYYGWLGHKPGKRELSNQALDTTIKSIFVAHKMRYGASRITKALNTK